MSILGFSISGHDNDSYAFYDREGLRRCASCGTLTHKWEESLDGLVIQKRRNADISATYDGVLVVSDAFVHLCQENDLEGLTLSRLPDDPGFWAISSDHILTFDAERRRTRFEELCQVCGHYGAIAGATPVFLKDRAIIPDRGFARTDIEFGSGNAKHPLLMCGIAAGDLLLDSGLRGLELRKIEMSG